jgi:hypothetical protein
MPLATKNNAIIVKDGKLAENCGCCGGWYCCADKACLAKPSSVTLSVVAEDFYTQYSATANAAFFNSEYQSSACFFGSAINGTHTLSEIAPPAGYLSAWQKTFPSAPSGCAPSVFTLRMSANSRIAFDFYYTFTGPLFFWAADSVVKSKSQMSCGMATSDTEMAYFRTFPLNAVASWSQCTELPFTHVQTRNIESVGPLIAARSFDTGFSASVTAVNQRTGSDTVAITVTLNQ